jgi:phosphoglycerate kinase
MEFEKLNFAGKKVLVRVDFNVPLDQDGQVSDDNRIRAELTTLNKILGDGGSAILMSHLGRPKGFDAKYSLRPVAEHLTSLLDYPVYFVEDCTGSDVVRAANELKPGEVLLLENLRFYGEEKAGDTRFAKKLASLGHFYLNDAFGTAHRAHASTAVIAEYFDEEKGFGALMEAEIQNAEEVLRNARHPFTAVMGGAKVSDKVGIIRNLLSRVDQLLIGGAMAYTFIHAQGGQTGGSLVETGMLDLARELLREAEEKDVKVFLPEDSVIGDQFSEGAQTQTVPSDQVPDHWLGLDIGPKAREQYHEALSRSHTILWNGPMGVFEMKPFAEGTIAVAKSIAEVTEHNDAFSLVGGGESVAAVREYGLENQISFVSTGGGALMEFLEGKELPGIAAIRHSAEARK